MNTKVTSIAWLGLVLAWSATDASAQSMTPRQIYKQAGKGVVLVFGTDGSAQGSAGTGTIVTADGQILTNAHVVSKERRPFKRLFVYLKPDKLQGSMRDDLKQRYEALLVDIDHDLDLALLKMKRPPPDLTVLELADPKNVEIGDPVVAIGHPETAGLWTLTTGVVSSVVKDFQGVRGKNVFQTEASINRGNSGGPLINEYGQMIGINTCISRRAQDGLAITDINFSLKSSVPVKSMKRQDLMVLSYGAHGASAPIAMAETAPAVAKAQPEAKPAAEAPPVQGEKPKSYVVTEKTKDGEISITVHEPEPGEDVAEDPEWDAETGGAAVAVAGSRKAPKRAARKKAAKAAKPKILTKARPYKLDPFVAARMKEIKALEDMMDDMSGKIRKKKKKSGFDGMGL